MGRLIVAAVVLLAVGVLAVTVLPLAREDLNVAVSSLAVVAGLTLASQPYDRDEMLKRVRHRIDDMLQSSLQNQTRIALGLPSLPDVIQRRMELRRPGCEPKPLPDGTTVSQVFDQVSGGLLILGLPGSGKTTALLELARDLLDRAGQDAQQPIPMVFNLSSWSQQPFADWLVEELHHSYEVPRRIARHWVDHNGIRPLLDGLDEVAAGLRDDCVTAINAFLRERKHLTLVVCGHAEEYQRLATRLGLENAAVLKPLTRQQVYDYFQAVGLGDVRAALQADDRLWELVGSPLMLNIVTLAYQDRPAEALREAGTIAQRRERLFADYTERMFTRRPLIGRRYTKDQAKRWLVRLAQAMRKHRQSEFDLDRVQPNWLPTAVQRRLVTVVPAIVSGVVGGLLVGLALRLAIELPARLGVGAGVVPGIGLADGIGVELLAGLVFALVAVGGGRDYESVGRPPWPWLGLGVGLVVGLVGGLAGGPVVGLVFGLVAMGVGLVSQLVRVDRIKGARWSWSRLLSGLVAGLAAGLAAGLVAGLAGGLVMGLVFGLAAMGAGLVYQLVCGDGMEGARATINPVEQLRWSRPRLGAGLAFGLVSWLGGGGFLTVLARWLRGGVDVLRDVVLEYGLGGGAVVAVVVVLIFVLSSGLGSGLAKKRVTPNEGIHRSVRRGVAVGLVSWLGVVLVSVLISAPVYTLRLFDMGVGLTKGIGVGLANGLVNGSVLGLVFGWALGLEFGGIAWLRHATLRGLMVRNGVAPWRYVAFLDDVAERLFLSKSGGSYIFRHPLFRDYFADRKAEDPPP